MDTQESRFTWAREYCPHPEYWHSNDSESTEYEVTELVAAFVRALQPDFVLETGTYIGQTTLAIGKALKQNGHGRIVSIELDGSAHAQAKQLTASLDNVTLINGNAMDYVPEAPIDFAFFDSCQTCRDSEFRRFREWMRPGIIVSFHDTAPHHLVGPTIRQLEADGLIKPIFLHTPRGISFAEVL